MTAEQLKEWRARHGLKQGEAADVLGAPHRTYENWEQGRRKIPHWVEREAQRIDGLAPA